MTASSPVAAEAAPAPPISDRERYSRQVLFAGIGESGQQLLRHAHAAIVGVGATGAATASLLARAGVGHLTLIDRDFVEPSNLQRQILFDEDDARSSLPKAEAARLHLARINSGVHVTAHIADLVPQNAADLLSSADIILDCTDNFETRYLLNDLCVRDGRPWIYAAAVGAYAATMNILPKPSPERLASNLSSRPPTTPPSPPPATPPSRPLTDLSSQPPTDLSSRPPTDLSSRPESAHFADAAERPASQTTTDTGAPFMAQSHRDMGGIVPPTACLACIFPSAPSGNLETCDTAGILSTAVNLAASIQATEALKFLTRQPHLMRRSLISFDLWSGEHSEISTTNPRPGCEVCDQRIFRALSGGQRPHITLCGRNSVQIHEHHRPLDLIALHDRLSPLGGVRANNHLLRFDYPPYTLTAFPDGRALIQGTTDIGLARSLYARFLGS